MYVGGVYAHVWVSIYTCVYTSTRISACAQKPEQSMGYSYVALSTCYFEAESFSEYEANAVVPNLWVATSLTSLYLQKHLHYDS